VPEVCTYEHTVIYYISACGYAENSPQMCLVSYKMLVQTSPGLIASVYYDHIYSKCALQLGNDGVARVANVQSGGVINFRYVRPHRRDLVITALAALAGSCRNV